MFGTDHNFEPVTRTFYVHVSASNRKTRVYRPRPSRQVLRQRAIAAGSRW